MGWLTTFLRVKKASDKVVPPRDKQRESSERERRLRELGIVPAPEVGQWPKLNEYGIEQVTDGVPTDPSAQGHDFYGEWISVASSNVDAIRWVGGQWGLQVRFKNGYKYEYRVAWSMYDQMLNAGSKGSFVHSMMKAGVPYRRWVPSSVPPQIKFPFGGIGGPTQGSNQ